MTGLARTAVPVEIVTIAVNPTKFITWFMGGVVLKNKVILEKKSRDSLLNFKGRINLVRIIFSFV
jgi:hypothetical protein